MVFDDDEHIEWLDLDEVAEVSIVSGGRRMPRSSGIWSIDAPGEQMIEIRFHEPTSVSHLRVTSSEIDQERTQEITVWASLNRGEQHRELLRQQFNFSPNGATEEIEEYAPGLEAVSAIQLRVVPSIDGRRAVARIGGVWIASI
jgi:hypothetical protein